MRTKTMLFTLTGAPVFVALIVWCLRTFGARNPITDVEVNMLVTTDSKYILQNF